MIQTNRKYIYLSIAIILVSLTRLIPHEYNASPLAALALFAGAKFENKKIGILLPLLATFFSDILVNNILYKSMFPTFTLFYDGWFIVYLSYALIAFLGMTFLKKDNALKVLGGAFAAAVLFYLVSNLSYWISFPNMYGRNFLGLMACYEAGLPFFRGTLVGTVLWSSILFGTYHLVTNYQPNTAPQKI